MRAEEQQWLDYAWRVVNCPIDHRRACERHGGAVPGVDRVDGNDLRWPGYLGRDYEAERGVLCVGAVHRESTPTMEAQDSVIAETNAELIAAARDSLAAGRSAHADSRYLAGVRSAYERALPRWGRWQRHFRTLIEDHLGIGIREIACTNLAKWRVSIDRGPRQRAAERELTRLCQRAFPAAELVEAIRPVAVLVARLWSPRRRRHRGRVGNAVMVPTGLGVAGPVRT